MVEKGLNLPAIKRAVDAISKGGKNLLDTLLSEAKRVGRQFNKRIIYYDKNNDTTMTDTLDSLLR